MGTTGKPLHAKLFLEGMEVPLIGATVTYSVNAAAIAYIDVVPHKTLNDIKPRTMVHLAIRDFHNPGEGFPFIKMFEGEVFGFQFGKSTTSRTLTLSCIDYSSYWDNAILYFLNPLSSLSKGTEYTSDLGKEITDVNSQKIPTKVVTHAISSFFLKELDGAEDLLQGLVNICKGVTKINEFYTQADIKLKIMERILLRSSGKLKELLKQDEARKWFEGITGRGTGYSTLRSMIQDFMSIIFHDFTPIPFSAKVGDKLGDFIFKPNMYMLPPPTCNIFYPDEYSNFSYSRNFFQEPTRLIYKPEMPSFLSQVQVTLKHAYSPEAFYNFMTKTAQNSATTGDGALQVSSTKNYGFFDDDDSSDAKDVNQGKKKEGQFLTNEERMKGILLSQETLIPAATAFRGSVKEQGAPNLHIRIANYLFFKKRFQGRDVQITSHLKPSVVPGFTALILDDSDADQSMVAYCNSVTHRVYANQGGYTNVHLSYARPIEEQDITTNSSNEPLVPPWFDEAVFGSVSSGKLKVGKTLGTFYASLLGEKGSDSINGYANAEDLVTAVEYIKKEYIASRTKGSETVDSLIKKVTTRRYTKLEEAFAFIGAYRTGAKNKTSSGAKAKDVDPLPRGEFMEYVGMPSTDMDSLRRSVIRKYRNALLENRGFRG